MLMHREVEEDRPQPDQVDGSGGSVPSEEEWDFENTGGGEDGRGELQSSAE